MHLLLAIFRVHGGGRVVLFRYALHEQPSDILSRGGSQHRLGAHATEAAGLYQEIGGVTYVWSFLHVICRP